MKTYKNFKELTITSINIYPAEKSKQYFYFKNNTVLRKYFGFWSIKNNSTIKEDFYETNDNGIPISTSRLNKNTLNDYYINIDNILYTKPKVIIYYSENNTPDQLTFESIKEFDDWMIRFKEFLKNRENIDLINIINLEKL